MARLSEARVSARRGLALVEMALVLPLLLILVFGMIEYGWMFLKAHQLSNAARHGVRIAVTPDATTAEVQSAVGTLMTQAGLDGSGYSLTIAPGDVSAASPGEPVRVTLVVAYPNIAIADVPLIPTPDTIGSSVTMAKEGP